MNEGDYRKLQTRMFRQYDKMELKIQKAEEALEAVKIALNFFLKDLQELKPNRPRKGAETKKEGT